MRFKVTCNCVMSTWMGILCFNRHLQAEEYCA